MTKNLYEIFQEFEKAKTETERRKILVDNRSDSLITFLQLAFDPRIKFTVNEIPKYNPSNSPVGMGYRNMGNVIKKTYMFIEGHPRRTNLTEEKQSKLLAQMLESLEAKEAELYKSLIKRQVKVPYLTPKLVEKAFPNIFEVPIRA